MNRSSCMNRARNRATFLLSLAAFAGLAPPGLGQSLPASTLSLSLDQCEQQVCGPFPPTSSYNGALSGFPGTAKVGTGSFVTASGFLSNLADEVPNSPANAANAAEVTYYFEVVPVGGGSTVAPVQIGVSGAGSASVAITSVSGNFANILVQLQLLSGESGGQVFSDSAHIAFQSSASTNGCTIANTSSATGAGFVSTPGAGGATIGCTSASMSGGLTESGSYTIETNSPYLITMQANISVGCGNGSDLSQALGRNQATALVVRPTISVPPGYMLVFGAGVGSSPQISNVTPSGNTTVAGDDNSGLTQNSPLSLEAQTVIDPDQFPTGPILITGLALRAAPGLGPLNATFAQSIYLSTSPNWANPTGHPLLSTTFANNVGPDNALVYAGTATVDGAACAAPGPCPFANSIPFAPFLYNPAKGPLLIDQQIASLDLTSGQIDVEDCAPASCPVAGIDASPLGTATASQVNASGTILQLAYSSAACSITGNITITVSDAQAAINQALGVTPPANDVNGDGVINVVDVQIVANAILSLTCTVNSTTTGSLSVSLKPMITTPAVRSGSSDVTVSADVAATAPPPVITAVVNAASLQNGPVSRGEVVTIDGTGLGPSIPARATPAQARQPVTSLAGVQVLFDGSPALLTFVSATQLKCVVPREAQGTSSVQVRYQDRASNFFPLGAIAASPALFTVDGSGRGPAAAWNQDQSSNSPSHPAARGATVILFLTGEGHLSPEQVRIGGQPASVASYGEAPGVVSGVMQLTVQIPWNVPSGDLPVSVSIGGNSSQDGVTVSVR